MTRSFVRALALPMVLAATPASAEWREASSDHFIVYADASESWMRDYSEHLERFASALQRLQPNGWAKGGPINRVTIYVVPSAEAIQKTGRTKLRRRILQAEGGVVGNFHSDG